MAADPVTVRPGAGGRPAGTPRRLAALLSVALVAAGCSGGVIARARSDASSRAEGSPASAATADPMASASSAPAPPSSPGPDGAAAWVVPGLTIATPASGTAGSGLATGVALSWASTDAVRTDVTESVTADPSPNLDCRGGRWRTAGTFVGASAPFRIPGALPGHCYRFVVSARSASGQVATATSGTLWIEPTWQGGVDLYRNGVFSTQQTIDWCVPASVEMVLNVVDGRTVHSRAEQAELYQYGRTQNYAKNPVPGLDPGSATALLRRAGQAYADYRAASLGLMEREAVSRLRRTGKPVILYVDAGVHAWVLTGFTASADPAATGAFAITSFSVMGPLWPVEQYHHRYYDMPPDARLSPATFAAAVRAPYHDWAARTPWEGWWVINEPL